MIYRYPRYGELFDAWQRAEGLADRAACSARRSFATCRCGRSSPGSTRSFRSTIPEVRDWVERGRNFTLADQRRMGEKQREIVGKVLPDIPEARGRRADRDLDHAVLPSDPAAALRFQYRRRLASRRAAAAALPLSAGRAPAARAWRASTCEQHFGVAPVGLWPSEGSVSDEVFTHRRRAGLRVGGDRQRRARSDAADAVPAWTGCTGPTMAAAAGARCGVIFRDHFMSDLIGFVYSKMDAARRGGRFPAPHSRELRRHSALAAAMRWCRSFSMARMPGNTTTTTAGRSCANCTARISDDPRMRAVTVSEALAAAWRRSRSTTSSRAPGSTPISMSGSAPRRTTRPGRNCCARAQTYDAADRRPGGAAAAGVRGTADRRGQRLVLVVRAGARFGQPRRVRPALSQPSGECLPLPGPDAARGAVAADSADRGAGGARRAVRADPAGDRWRGDLVLRVAGRGQLSRGRAVAGRCTGRSSWCSEVHVRQRRRELLPAARFPPGARAGARRDGGADHRAIGGRRGEKAVIDPVRGRVGRGASRRWNARSGGFWRRGSRWRRSGIAEKARRAVPVLVMAGRVADGRRPAAGLAGTADHGSGGSGPVGAQVPRARPTFC